MSQPVDKLSDSIKSDSFNGIMDDLANIEDMTSEQRREVVLSFLAEHGLALKPKSIYRNLRFHHRITFGDETVKNILKELDEQGHARRIDPSALEKGDLVDLPEGEGRGAYIVTEEGRDHLR